jgi:predicted MFS family arabinose efflux permease
MSSVEAVRRRAPAGWKLGLLSLLYFVQGLPFGFQSKGLKLALTGLGLSMTTVTLSGLLAAPWSFKPLWGPFVDRHGSATFGRRTSWIVPLQVLLALSFVAAAFMPPNENLRGLMVAVFFMNLFASTQDVPVDGLAVDLLSANELGAGNAVQVVGYKLGMIVGGSVLIAQLPRFGWQGVFFAMAATCVAVTAVLLFVKEPSAAAPEAPSEKPTWREVWQRAKAMFTQPGAWWLIAFVGLYKAGETVATSVFEPFLQRVGGYPIEQVAAFGGWGMIGSLAGSVAGGVLATRVTLLRAVGWAAAVRAIPLVAMWALVAGFIGMTASNIIAITTIEHFFGGMLTTTMFAFMMSKVDRRIGATQFTLFASIEVLGKEPWGLASGALADRFGWSVTFALAVALSVAYLGLLVPMSRLQKGLSDSE